MLDIARRRDLYEFINEVVSHTYEHLVAGERFEVGQAMLKSYVVERHPNDDIELQDRGAREAFLTEAVGSVNGEVEETEEGRLFLFDCPADDDEDEPVSFAVDMRDDRYWQFHTASKTVRSDRIVSTLTTDGPYLDTAWLPGHYLNRQSERGSLFKVRVSFDDGELFSRIPSGRHQPALLIDEDNGVRLVDSSAFADEEDADRPYAALQEGRSEVTLNLKDYSRLRAGLQELQDTRYLSDSMNITRAEFRYLWNGVPEEFSNARLYNWGKVTASGTSGDAHVDLMSRLIADYRERIENIERVLGCRDGEEADDTGQLKARPANIEYNEVDNFERFVLNLFSGNKPFRLTGTPQFKGRGYAVVSAFDLHARQPLRFEITPEYMTVMLPSGGCGNTIARLYTNLLEHLDANAKLYGESREAPFF